MGKERKNYCRKCKHSKYVMRKGVKQLFCEQRLAFGMSGYMPADATDAEECLDYDPEYWRDALTSRHAYQQAMKDCGIPLEDEKEGILCNVPLPD